MTRRIRRRSGFTLLELLVSLAIIGILISLLMVSLFKARVIAEELDVHREILALNNAIKAFGQDHRLGQAGYIPSQIDPTGNDPMSQGYLRKLFIYTGGGLNPMVCPPAKLEGSQTYVFFLGGPLNQGWSADPQDPTASYGMRIRFYEFDSARLKDVHGNGYPSYCDRFGTPYAYFCSRRDTQTTQPPFYIADNVRLGQLYTANPLLGLPPYTTQNVGGFQIISAGADRKFGQRGNLWTPVNSMLTYPAADPGQDDFSNFSKRLLGSRQ